MENNKQLGLEKISRREKELFIQLVVYTGLLACSLHLILILGSVGAFVIGWIMDGKFMKTKVIESEDTYGLLPYDIPFPSGKWAKAGAIGLLIGIVIAIILLILWIIALVRWLIARKKLKKAVEGQKSNFYG